MNRLSWHRQCPSPLVQSACLGALPALHTHPPSPIKCTQLPMRAPRPTARPAAAHERPVPVVAAAGVHFHPRPHLVGGESQKGAGKASPGAGVARQTLHPALAAKAACHLASWDSPPGISTRAPMLSPAAMG